jgi:hypothetical protein
MTKPDRGSEVLTEPIQTGSPDADALLTIIRVLSPLDAETRKRVVDSVYAFLGIGNGGVE